MASTINASSSGSGGLIYSGDTSGVLGLQANGSTVASLSSAGLAVTGSITNNGVVGSPYTMKNRIINGDMRIAQRGTSAISTDSGGAHNYFVDRWCSGNSQASKFTGQQSTVAPTGFSNSLLITSTSAYTVGSGEQFIVQQIIEGFNWYDLGWGTANAQTVTLSFWVRSSLTGTFGGCMQNDNGSRQYPFSYTISAANTWEQKTITITGDTSGTWVGSSNAAATAVVFSMGAGSTISGTAGAWTSSYHISTTGATSVVGTNGATWYITGVQLEVGSVATSFERRIYGQELLLCQRYFHKDMPGNNYAPFAMGNFYSSTTAQIVYPHKVTMRTQPTVAVNAVSVQAATTVTNNISSVAGAYYGYDSTLIELTVSGFTARDACWLNTGPNGSTAYVTLSAEL